MAVMTKDQIRHQVINLRKTLVLLENSVKKEDWSKFSHKERNDKWLKAQSILSGINYCKGMLNNLTPEHYDYGLGERSSVSGKEFHEESNRILEKLEFTINEVYEDLKPVPRRLTPILPTIPKPVVKRPDSPVVIAEEEEKEQPQAHDSEITSSSLLDPPPPSYNEDKHTEEPSHHPTSSTSTSTTSALLPPNPSASSTSTSTSSTTPTFLKTSTALHTSLSHQLATMAHQLRLNAEHLNTTLSSSSPLLASTSEKLDSNYEVLTRERVRLRDHGVRSGRTTCFVLGTVGMVVVAFVMTFFVIRIT